jgi:hypothetical protein
MPTYKCLKKGYYYKISKDGKKTRISHDTYLKHTSSKSKKQRGGSNHELKVLTLNIGGINSSSFEYYDNISSNNAGKSPLEKYSDQMKKEIIQYLVENSEKETTKIPAGATNIQKKEIFMGLRAQIDDIIGNKDPAEVKRISPTLAQIWLLAKQLDSKMKDFNKVRRFSPLYKVFNINEDLMDEDTFRRRWIKYWIHQSNGLNRNSINNVLSNIGGLKRASANVRNSTVNTVKGTLFTPEDFESLIKFDYLTYRALKNSGITQEEYENIHRVDLSSNKKAEFIYSILMKNNFNINGNENNQHNLYDIIFLQESVSEIFDGVNKKLSEQNSIEKYIIMGTPSRNGPVTIVKESLGHFEIMGDFMDMMANLKHEKKVVNNKTGVEKTVVTTLKIDETVIYINQENRIILVNSHFDSDKKKSAIQSGLFNKLLEEISSRTPGYTIIGGIDANMKGYTSHPGIHVTPALEEYPFTTNKIRTWVQTQMNKAGKHDPKWIDYIFTNGNIEFYSIFNNDISKTRLTPCGEWPFDHFGVQAIINIPTGNHVETSVKQVEMAGEHSGGKKKKTIQKRKTKKIGGKKKLPSILFDDFRFSHRDGWNELSKKKPVATFASGYPEWFYNNFLLYTEEEKQELLQYISQFLTRKNKYPTEVKIYIEITESGRGISFFYIPEYFRIACELVGYSFEEAADLILHSNSNSPNQKKRDRLIHLVFGDYYKGYFKQYSIETEGFMDLLRRYNAEVGLPDPNSLPMYNQEY